MGIKNDDWPDIFDEVFSNDILVIGTPIWLGERSSVASLLIERLCHEQHTKRQRTLPLLQQSRWLYYYGK